MRPGPTLLGCAAVLAAVSAGCGGKKGIATAEQLADALKQQGVAWETSGPTERPEAKASRVIDEELCLKGEDLEVEVYRVANDRYFKTAAMGLLLRCGFEPEESEHALVDVLVQKPFLVAVASEPEEGLVRRAFFRVFPKAAKPSEEKGER